MRGPWNGRIGRRVLQVGVKVQQQSCVWGTWARDHGVLQARFEGYGLSCVGSQDYSQGYCCRSGMRYMGSAGWGPRTEIMDGFQIQIEAHNVG